MLGILNICFGLITIHVMTSAAHNYSFKQVLPLNFSNAGEQEKLLLPIENWIYQELCVFPFFVCFVLLCFAFLKDAFYYLLLSQKYQKNLVP